VRKILVINGPNLNILGDRENEIYGDLSLDQINNELLDIAEAKGVNIEFFQSNCEGSIVDRIQSAKRQADYLIINAGAYTHYSIAIYDALKAVKIPFIEVHLSNPEAREEFRHKSILSPIAAGKICGFGALSYKLAVLAACEYIMNDYEVDNV
jgi:3-dehydroquinate dehydratase-2